MKTKKQFFFLAFTAVLMGMALTTSASEKETRPVSGFTAIKVSSGIDLYLKMGDSEHVTVVASDDIIDDIVTEVKDGVLKIYMKDRLFRWNWNKEMKAYVSVKKLEKIAASAGSDVKAENTITGNSLEIDVSSGSDLKMHVDVEDINLETSSGSDATLSGKAKNFEASASSGSGINASELVTKNCKVEVSSGSDASVNATDELEAHASSGADVRYSGDPKSKDIHKSSGGDVYKK